MTKNVGTNSGDIGAKLRQQQRRERLRAAIPLEVGTRVRLKAERQAGYITGFTLKKQRAIVAIRKDDGAWFTERDLTQLEPLQATKNLPQWAQVGGRPPRHRKGRYSSPSFSPKEAEGYMPLGYIFPPRHFTRHGAGSTKQKRKDWTPTIAATHARKFDPLEAAIYQRARKVLEKAGIPVGLTLTKQDLLLAFHILSAITAARS